MCVCVCEREREREREKEKEIYSEKRQYRIVIIQPCIQVEITY